MVDYKGVSELLNHRKLVCADLWDKGYYIGSGTDYGGDFTIYTGKW